LNPVLPTLQTPEANLQKIQQDIQTGQVLQAQDIAKLTTDQQQAAQALLLQTAGNQFQTKANKGKVSPDVYNVQQQNAVKLGISQAGFDGQFSHYTYQNDPRYSTDNGQQLQQALGEAQTKISNIVRQYGKIPKEQKGATDPRNLFSNIPFLSHVIDPLGSGYETNVRGGLAATLAPYVGGGQGTGLRINQTELNQWVKLLPSVWNTEVQNRQNLNTLDGEFYAKFHQNLPQELYNTLGDTPPKDGMYSIEFPDGTTVKGTIDQANAEGGQIIR